MQTQTSSVNAVAPGPMTARSPLTRARRGEVILVFQLSGESFALPVDTVFEILDPIPTTRVPNAPLFVRDLINVRGTIAPLLDLRRRLLMPAPEADTGSRIIVLELPVDGQSTRLAILADSVDEVIEVDSGSLEPIPDLGARWPEPFVRGVCTNGNRLVVLLEPETLLAPDGHTTIHS